MNSDRQTLNGVRFFVDEDLSGLGLALIRLRRDVVLGGRPPADSIFPPNDPDWIPVVADLGLVVITNDRRIRTRPGEADVASAAGLRCVHLRPRAKNPTQWDFLVQLIEHWPSVEALADRPGPIWLELRGSQRKELAYRPGHPPRLPTPPASTSHGTEPPQRTIRMSWTRNFRHR